MSCIPKILEIKGDKKILPIPGKGRLLIEGGGHYNGYDYLITFNNMGFRCGYVAITSEHPLFNANLEGWGKDDSETLDVHGGVTFFDQHSMAEALIKHPCEDKWIGFDCGHAGDKWDLETALEYFKDDEEALKNITGVMDVKEKVAREMESDFPGYHKQKEESNDWCEEVRSKDYVESQCIYLIEQLIEKQAA